MKPGRRDRSVRVSVPSGGAWFSPLAGGAVMTPLRVAHCAAREDPRCRPARGFGDHAAAMAGSVHGGDSRARAQDVRRLFRNTRFDVSGLGYLYQLAAAAGWTSLPFLPLIRQPVLVMGGEDDPIVPVANARILAALIPTATLHVFAGGHVEPLTAATDFGPRITQFLTRPQP